MRMSDLMACDVAHRRRHGPRPGPRRAPRHGRSAGTGSCAALRVDALLVGGSALAGRLGYLRGGVRGPALLAAVMRRLEARAVTIDARDIEAWDLDAHRLMLAPGATTGADPDR